MAKAITNEKDLKQAQIKRRFNLQDKVVTLRWIMGSPLGRSFVWWLLEEAQIFNSTIGPHHEMCALEGKRSIGLKLFHIIQGDEETWGRFREAQKENTRKEQADENE